jgi:branched-chain amino acid transport system permease protein
MNAFQQLLQQLINGAVIGLIYSLISLGYTMVFGILGFINFAHGEIYMMGAYFGLVLIRTGKFNIFSAFIISMVLTAILGVAIEHFIYKRVRRRGKQFLDALLVAAIGVSIFLQTLAQLIWGAQTNTMNVDLGKTVYKVGGLYFSQLQVIITIIAILLMIALTLFVKKTLIGTAMRATSQDMVATQLMGISVNKVISATFLVSSALAAAAGILVGVYFDSVYPLMGNTAGLKAFTAAVLGGIGSIPGAMLAGLIIGLTENLGAAYISSTFRDGFSFVVLILTLLFLPNGLFKVKRDEGK